MTTTIHDGNGRQHGKRPRGDSSTQDAATCPLAPVVAIQVVPGDRLYRLDGFTFCGEPKGRIAIGRASACDIVLDDGAVSSLHCFLRRKRNRVLLEEYDARNKFLVDGVRVQHGSVELRPGTRVDISRFSLYACGDGTEQPLTISAKTLGEFVDQALARYDQVSQTARLIGVPQSTLYQWIKTGRFGITYKLDHDDA